MRESMQYDSRCTRRALLLCLKGRADICLWHIHLMGTRVFLRHGSELTAELTKWKPLFFFMFCNESFYCQDFGKNPLQRPKWQWTTKGATL